MSPFPPKLGGGWGKAPATGTAGRIQVQGSKFILVFPSLHPPRSLPPTHWVIRSPAAPLGMLVVPSFRILLHGGGQGVGGERLPRDCVPEAGTFRLCDVNVKNMWCCSNTCHCLIACNKPTPQVFYSSWKLSLGSS